MKSCSSCGGHGQVMMASGFFRMTQTCSACGGRGEIVSEFCQKCHGKGNVRMTRNIDVDIPAGVDNSSRLRVRGEGEIAQGGPGDLYLYIHVLEHQTFQRDGNDIYMELALSFVTAALGGEVSVPTLNGKVKMKIPSGTQSGKIMRLRSKGMPDLHGGMQGDQYVKVMLQVPKNLNQEQRKILEEFAKISGEHVDPKGGSIREKIKKVFK